MTAQMYLLYVFSVLSSVVLTSALGGFSEVLTSTGHECLLDRRRTRASNRLQLSGQMFGQDGEKGYVSAVFSGPSTRGMDEPNAEVTVSFGDMLLNTSTTLLQHTQQLFTPSDVVTVATYPPLAKNKDMRDHLNIYVTFTTALLAAENIELVSGRFYFIELTLESHYRDYSLRCHRLDAVYTGGDVMASQISDFNVLSFGAVGDGHNDDTSAIQSAINAAAAVGGTVDFPPGHFSTSVTLQIPAGVTLEGAGLGANPRDMSGMKGSIIMYRGVDFAMTLGGDLIEIKDLVVYDNGVGGGTAAGGVLLDASEGQYLESVSFKRVLIFRFTAGTGLLLNASKGGAVTYSSFYDVRVRNAKIGIHLKASGIGGSFVNSNSFYKGAISGGGFDYCFLVEGPGANNNHNIDGLVMEPYTSTYGHLYVTGPASQINAVNIRIEAANQPNTIPMVHFGPETYHSKVSGLFSAGWIDANRMAHQLDISAGKYVGASFSHNNLFLNTAFRGLPSFPVEVDSSTIPGWTLQSTSTASTVSIDNTRQILHDHNVIRLSVPPGAKVTMKPHAVTKAGEFSLYLSASFGMYTRYVDTSQVTSSLVYATFDTSITGVTTSLVHPGTNTDWLFLSMVGNIPEVPSGTTVDIYPYFVFQNTHSTNNLEVEFTLPTFSFGAEPPQIESGSVQTSGGIMHGTLSTGLVKNIDYPVSGYFYVLPKDGNVFLFQALASGESYPTMLRLNHLAEDRFPQGTVITLLFLVENVSIGDSAYINLKSGFTSSSHCSLVLLAMGDGTWVEVSRDV